MKTQNRIEGNTVKDVEMDCPNEGGSTGELTLESVMAEHESALLRYAARILNNAEAAQDVVQDAFVRLYRHWQAAIAQGKVLHWLYRTTHNAAVDHIRRESRLRRLHEAAGEESAPYQAAPQLGHADAEEKRLLALTHLERLAPPERQVLILRLQEGLSYQDISRITGRSVGNVGCLLHHATRNLSRSLKKAGVIE